MLKPKTNVDGCGPQKREEKDESITITLSGIEPNSSFDLYSL
jgi:hypothetical protein